MTHDRDDHQRHHHPHDHREHGGHGHDHAHCRDLAARLSELVDDELPDDLRREIEAHLGDCADCERFVESLERVRALGHEVPAPALAPERLHALGEKVKARLESEE